MIRLVRLYAHDFKQLQEIEIRFPEVGRVLVQGKNEAGKSTLFEAVFFALFGQAITTEAGARNLDDLIRYEMEKARVELDVSARDRLLKITRTLVRGKSNKWELEIVYPDGRTEEVRSNKAVNDRLVAELGFDAEALLNTCFVEQKKLEKLEGMSKSKREESLSKLLNLERLLDMEDDLKLRGDDEKLITRLGHRVELAYAQAEMPGVTDELDHAEGQLCLLDLGELVARAIAEREHAAELDAQLAARAAERAELERSVARVEALDRARQALAATLIRYDTLARESERLQSLQAERDAIQQAVQEQLPALEERRREIRRLFIQAARLSRVEVIRANVTLELQRASNLKQELDGNLERGSTLNATITESEARLSALDEKLRAYDVGQALGEWAQAVSENDPGTAGQERLTTTVRERDALNVEQRRYITYLIAVVVGVGVASAILLPALVLTSNNLALGVIAALVLAALATIAVILLTGRLVNTNRHSVKLTEEIGKLEGEMTVRRSLSGAAQERTAAAAAKLAELQTPVPASASAAQARRIDLAATLENKTRAELADERAAISESLNYARAQRDEVTRRIAEMSPATDGGSVPQLECARDKAERILNKWRPRLARRAARYDVAPETQALRDAYTDTRNDVNNLRARAQQADKLAADAAQAEQRIAGMRGELESDYARAADALNGSAPAWSPALERAAYVALGAQLALAYQEAGGDTVRTKMAQLNQQLGALDKEHTISVRNAQQAITQARGIETRLGIEDGLSAEPTLEELQTAASRLSSSSLPARETLQERVKGLNQRLGELRGTRERFERELGLVGETVDAEVAQDELVAERHTQLQRKFGTEIVGRARRQIVQKVLPATMEYMRRILPQLTRDRYHDAELDPETFKIRVWDERAGQSGAWKEKNIFSGGTKDQFSLALRLAFALATLPQERGTSPGFIFLDEPLGSFDDERANALLYLLTEGEIGQAFDQIFLISHVPVQESKFTHRIRLEHGQLVENRG